MRSLLPIEIFELVEMKVQRYLSLPCLYTVEKRRGGKGRGEGGRGVEEGREEEGEGRDN